MRARVRKALKELGASRREASVSTRPSCWRSSCKDPVNSEMKKEPELMTNLEQRRRSIRK